MSLFDVSTEFDGEGICRKTKHGYPGGNVFPYADRVNTISVDDTFRWLGAGWQDFR